MGFYFKTPFFHPEEEGKRRWDLRGKKKPNSLNTQTFNHIKIQQTLWLKLIEVFPGAYVLKLFVCRYIQN